MEIDEFRRFVEKQKSFLIFGKKKMYEINITWLKKKKRYLVHMDKDYFCKSSEEILELFYCGYSLEKWIKEGEVLLCIRDEEAEKFALQRYIISQYQERCRKKLKQGYRKNEKEAFWELFEDYSARGGNSYIHSIVEPVMRELKVVDLNPIIEYSTNNT